MQAHCQSRTSQRTDQSFVKELAKPTHNRMTDRTKEEHRTDNSGFAKKRVQWLIEHSTSHQLLLYVYSLVLRNPLLRKAAIAEIVTLHYNKTAIMRKTIIIILFMNLLFNSVKGQNCSVRLFVTDSYNRKDTIEFGLNNTATVGVDSSFGEQDIYGQPWDSLDMRIIQRDSIDEHCLMDLYWNSSPLYYDNNRDFKIDYRPLTYLLGTINLYFEILIKSSNPPIYITTDFSGISMNRFEYYSTLHLLDSNCTAIESESIYFSSLNDTIYFSNNTLTTLVANLAFEVGVEETNIQRVKIYPNPAQTEINVISDIPIFIKLYDVFGREIKVCNESKLNILELEKGVYILGVFDINGNQIKIEKIIKE